LRTILYKLLSKKEKKELISTTVGAVISVGIFNDNPITAALTTPLDFKFFNFLKDVLFQFYHLFLEGQKGIASSLTFFFVRKTSLGYKENKTSI